MAETKIIYHIDEEETPYLVKIPIAAENITLLDFKQVLNKPNYKFFFKSMDQDFGVVKEEISDDGAKLPCFNGRVVSWVVCIFLQTIVPFYFSLRRCFLPFFLPFPFYSPNATGSVETLDDQTETESVVSFRRERPRHRESLEPHGPRMNGQTRLERHLAGYESSSTVMSSELDTTSFCDSEDDDTMSSSVTDSTMSLNIITVTLNMEKYNFLGISIVGQSNERGDGGIYIGSIMKGGAVAADGRIEPGDMLLQVNDINFENMSNDDAVRVLREIVHNDPPPPISWLTAVTKTPPPLSLLSDEPIRPIDPAAWVSHSVAMTGVYPPFPGSSSLSTITSSSSVTETERFDDFNLSLHSDMASVAKAMASPESGLEVRDRMWLKITIPNAFLGSDVVEWLFHHIEGFQDRREARKYASNLLKAGFIRHPVKKKFFVFDMANLSLNDNDGSSGASDQDTLAPLPLPGASPWPMMHTFPYQPYPTHAFSSQPPPYHELTSYSYAPGSTGSQHREGSRSSGSTRSEGERRRSTKGPGSTVGGGEKSPSGVAVEGDSRSGSGSESEYSTRSSLRRGHGSAAPSEHSHASSQRSHHHRLPQPPHMSPYPPGILPYNPMMVMMVPQHPHPAMAAHGHPHAQQLVAGPMHPTLAPMPSSTPGGPPGAPPTRDLGAVPPELTASRQSFHLAMGNPSEFFVDVM
uniref:Dishevelled segment polarity protein 2 n=1 Tax=Gasterosteus aculeatus aculeatus TaxID=481459 RepID=G3Q6P6_GASAC